MRYRKGGCTEHILCLCFAYAFEGEVNFFPVAQNKILLWDVIHYQLTRMSDFNCTYFMSPCFEVLCKDTKHIPVIKDYRMILKMIIYIPVDNIIC